MSEGNIRILYNACYGGFSISDRAIEEINKRKDTRLRSKYALEQIYNRSDPVVLEVFDLLGSKEFSGEHAKIRAHTIDAKYAVISEYDGLETVDVNMYNYEIHSVLSSTEITDGEKVKKLKEVFGVKVVDQQLADQQLADQQLADQQVV